jgi:subtilase family serine protease
MFCSAKSAAILVLSIAAALASSAQTGPNNRILQAVDANQSVIVRGSAHPLAKPEFDAGQVDGGMRINGASLVFNLSPEQHTALQALLREQQDRSSSKFHKWLTPEQYAARFGMTQSDLAKVTAWLHSEGFQVNSISRGHTRISFSGTAAQIESAFRTEIHHYRVNGELHFANATDLSVPAAFAGTVLAVGNLGDLRPKPKSSRRSHDQSSPSSASLSPHYTDSNTGYHYLAPADFATIYDLNPLYTAGLDGTGQSIAIMGQSAIYTSDIVNFRAAAGLPALVLCPASPCNLQQMLVPNSGTATVINADLTEADLDLEWAEGIAPNVNLVFVFVGNAPNYNAFDALDYTIENNLAPVISITYGNCEQTLGITEAEMVQQWVQQANSQGETVIAASGDSGAADCDPQIDYPATQGLAVDVPASIPEVTGVGGTEFNEQADPTTTFWNTTNAADGGSAISYIPEKTWNDTLLNEELSASGGGASTFFVKPSWQVGANVPQDNARDVPDIALSASSDNDPYLICSTPNPATPSCVEGFIGGNGKELSSGGTSFGAPTFAAIVALINQNTGSSQGNVNPTLYALAGTTPTAFHDITTGSNDVPCAVPSPDCPSSGPNMGIMGFTAGPGYDQTTGWGSLDASVLVNAWPPAYSFSATPISVSIAAAGDQGTSSISLVSNVGFSPTVTLTCTPQPGVYGLTCEIKPSTVTAGSPTATLTVLTVGSGSASVVTPHFPFAWLVGISGTLFAGMCLLELPFFRRRRAGLPLLLLLACVAAEISCGGSSSSQPPPVTQSTPAGSYTIKITGTTSNASVSTTVTAAVQ